MVFRRCMSHSHPSDKDRFHDKRVPCPYCGDEASPFNKSLQMAMLNNHLYGQVERQRSEVDFVKKTRRMKAPK